LIGDPETYKPLERLRRRIVINIETDFKGKGKDVVD
jgi:hypothetical protein